MSELMETSTQPKKGKGKKGEKGEKVEKGSYACKLCGPFADHTKHGHDKQIENLMSFSEIKLSSFVNSNIITRLRKRTDFSLKEHEVHSLTVEKPAPPSGEQTQYEQILCSPGRNFVALLTHSRGRIRGFTAAQVFEWAKLISQGCTWTPASVLPIHLISPEEESSTVVLSPAVASAQAAAAASLVPFPPTTTQIPPGPRPPEVSLKRRRNFQYESLLDVYPQLQYCSLKLQVPLGIVNEVYQFISQRTVEMKHATQEEARAQGVSVASDALFLEEDLPLDREGESDEKRSN